MKQRNYLYGKLAANTDQLLLHYIFSSLEKDALLLGRERVSLPIPGNYMRWY